MVLFVAAAAAAACAAATAVVAAGAAVVGAGAVRCAAGPAARSGGRRSLAAALRGSARRRAALRRRPAAQNRLPPAVRACLVVSCLFLSRRRHRFVYNNKTVKLKSVCHSIFNMALAADTVFFCFFFFAGQLSKSRHRANWK